MEPKCLETTFGAQVIRASLFISSFVHSLTQVGVWAWMQLGHRVCLEIRGQPFHHVVPGDELKLSIRLGGGYLCAVRRLTGLSYLYSRLLYTRSFTEPLRAPLLGPELAPHVFFIRGGGLSYTVQPGPVGYICLSLKDRKTVKYHPSSKFKERSKGRGRFCLVRARDAFSSLSRWWRTCHNCD